MLDFFFLESSFSDDVTFVARLAKDFRRAKNGKNATLSSRCLLRGINGKMWVYHANPAPAAHKIDNSHGSQVNTAQNENAPTTNVRATASEYINARRAATGVVGGDRKLPYHIILPNGRALVGSPVTSIKCISTASEKASAQSAAGHTQAASGTAPHLGNTITREEDAEEAYQLDFQSSHFTWTWRARYLILSMSEFYAGDNNKKDAKARQFLRRLSFCGTLLLLLQLMDFGLIVANSVHLVQLSVAANAARMVTLRNLYPQKADWLPSLLFILLPCTFCCTNVASLLRYRIEHGKKSMP